VGHETARSVSVALSTATGVAFAGDPHRVFKAVDLHTHGHGAVADTPLDPPVEGFPISFRLGGMQHVAVETRLGGRQPAAGAGRGSTGLPTPVGRERTWA
jgi:hypothetical protein